MKPKFISAISVIFFALLVAAVFAVSATAQEYTALKGVKQADTIFDFRDANPASALVHLSLVRDTCQDKAIQGMAEKSHFVVVFMGGSVKMLSSNRKDFTDEEKKSLEKLDQVIAAMAKDGIKMEVCLFAANVFGVDPTSISQAIDRVPNGWISSIGYQSQGYVLVPVY